MPSVIIEHRVMIPRVVLRVGVFGSARFRRDCNGRGPGRRGTIRLLNTFEITRHKLSSMIVKRGVMILRVPHTSVLRVGVLVLLYAEGVEALLR